MKFDKTKYHIMTPYMIQCIYLFYEFQMIELITRII